MAGLDKGRDLPPILRHAVAFIHESADADIGLEDIAAAVSVSPRSVQYAFRRHLDTTPLEYLRRVRLDRAHRDLKAADPANDTVTAIAGRWGFTHAGRFSLAYKAAVRHRAQPHAAGLPGVTVYSANEIDVSEQLVRPDRAQTRADRLGDDGSAK